MLHRGFRFSESDRLLQFTPSFPWLVIQLLSIIEFDRFLGGWLRNCLTVRQLGTKVAENGVDWFRSVGFVRVPFTVKKLIPVRRRASPRSDGFLGRRLSYGNSFRWLGVFENCNLLERLRILWVPRAIK